MKKLTFTFVLLFILFTITFSQQMNFSRLKVFIDCSNTWCDMQHIRSEINVVDFLLDNTAADVHVLITSQYTASGSSAYQLIFFGQQHYKNQRDTLHFLTHANATEFEERALLFQSLKTGLIPFIAKTSAIKDIDINLKALDTTTNRSLSPDSNKDPWKAWVMNVGGGGSLNADANYDTKNYYSNFSANRITENYKLGFGAYYNKNRSTFEFEENGVTESFLVNNHYWSVNHYIVKSLNSHWSAAYELKYSQSTFSNNKGRGFMQAGVEYNIFPYKEVNNKLFTISYSLTGRLNSYYDTTIYNKKSETLFGHRTSVNISFNQKWGNTYAGITYQNYFSDWKLFNLRMDVYTSIRVTGGLSLYVLAFGGLTRDQVFLVKGNATAEEVIARRRQLASGYNFYTSLGINFRFGSKLNNVVNPRFDRSSALNED